MSNMMSGGCCGAWAFLVLGHALHPARHRGAGGLPLLHGRQMRQDAVRVTLVASRALSDPNDQDTSVTATTLQHGGVPPGTLMLAVFTVAGERGLMAAYRLAHKIWEPSLS